MPGTSPPGIWRLICPHPGRVFHHLLVLAGHRRVFAHHPLVHPG